VPAGGPLAQGAGDAVAISLVPSTQEIVPCSGSAKDLDVTVRLTNPNRLTIGGYQVFVRFPAEYFEAIRYDAEAIDGFLEVSGPAPLGNGLKPCDGEPDDGAADWADGAGEDVVGVVAAVFGGGNSQPFSGDAADLGRIVFRARGKATPGQTGVQFSVNQEACRKDFDFATRAFDVGGKAITTTTSAPFSVKVAAASGPAVTSLTCQDKSTIVTLTWSATVQEDFYGYSIYRNSVKLLQLPKAWLTHDDEAPPDGTVVYEVAILLNLSTGAEGCRSSCTVVRGSGPQFLRGDANRDGKVNMSDPIAVLDRLFKGGGELACEDAADADDSGKVNLTDAVIVLDFLFKSGPSPAPPTGSPGQDPTPDGLGCSQ